MPTSSPSLKRAVLTTDRLNITQNPKNTNDQPSEQTSYSPTSNHYYYLVSQMTSPTCCSVKPACTGHRWPLRRRGWHHVWCVDLSSVSSTIVPGRLQWSSWRTLITQKHFLWGWSGSPPLFLVGRALSWATFARSQHMNQYMHTGPRMPSEICRFSHLHLCPTDGGSTLPEESRQNKGHTTIKGDRHFHSSILPSEIKPQPLVFREKAE